jgi:molecular chaperone GrpE (heat shock protein)
VNHIGDVNKLVSDTPRTDKAWKTTHSVYEFTVEMKRMERELNEANKTISLQHELMTTAEKRGVDKAKEELNEAKDRIKRLEREIELFREHADYGDVCLVEAILKGEEIGRKEKESKP